MTKGLVERIEGDNREAQMVVIERDETGWPSIWCDPEIADLVRALNSGGVKTVASCSGHGHRPGNIALADGRELVIARDYAEARKIDKLFPVDVNGEAASLSPIMAAKAKLRSRGFRVTGNSNPLGEYRIRNFAAGIDYRVSQQELIEVASSLRAKGIGE